MATTTLEPGCHCGRGGANSSASGARNNNNNSILYSILKSSDSSCGGTEEQQHQQQQQHTLHHLTGTSHSSSSRTGTSSNAAGAPTSTTLTSTSFSSSSSRLQLARQQHGGTIGGGAGGCSCSSTRRRGTLRSPQVTCKAASAVLVKTLRFVKSVPCFRELPDDDQLVLVRSEWAPLLVLGLAQDRVDFETTETAAEPSMLQRILLNTGGGGGVQQPTADHLLRRQDEGTPPEQSSGGGSRAAAAGGVSVLDIQAIKAFLKKCWTLDISTKEYAYLKGAVLFNPDLEGLRCLHYIQSLRREAHKALNEHVKLIHREDSTRFAKLLIALSMLRAISAPTVAQLFFKPVIGSVNMEEALLEMFYGK